MKKLIPILLFAVVAILVSFVLISLHMKNAEEDYINNTIQILPPFTFPTLNNNVFSEKNLVEANDEIIINYFNPDCEHCQYMAQSYLQNAAKIKDIQIIMVTYADSASTEKFVTDYKLNTMSNIVVLLDTKFQFEKIFGPSVVPSFFVYQDKKLVKKINGETKIENLMN